MEQFYTLVQSHAIVISAVILILAYIFIALEKIPKVTIALLGAAVVVFTGLVSQEKVGETGLNELYFINFVDFNVIFLLVSMMIIVNVTTRCGVFKWIAIELLKMTKGHPLMVLIVLSFFTAILSAFLDNVTTVILVMPITFVVAKQLDLNPIPLLIAEVFSSNIGGTATLIGDPPNIIIGSAAGFSFMNFLSELTIICLIIMVAVIGFLYLCFKKQLKTTEEKMAKILELDNSKTITDYALLKRSLLILGLVILGFITHDITHIATCIIAFIGASILLLFEKPEEAFKDVEWNTIFFFIGLFIIIGAFEAAGGIKLMADWLLKVTAGSQKITSFVILWASGILSGIIDNIPYTATMAPMIQEIELIKGRDYVLPLWWCLSLGACLGGNLTIIGAAANVIVSENAAKNGHPIKFLSFMKYGIVVVFISLSLATGYIWIRHFM
ncbi:MAG: ArsB/NhaD family transporter [Candidatus Gastranaerophilales bacterium]|nr:ArsB/NhaD family transporter [Candidatus Gastranaerophilales bacterium]